MRVAKVDSNQAEIVQAFRVAGCSVQHLHAVGQGCPDLAVGKNGITLMVEVKTPEGRMTDDQKRWADRWRGSFLVCRSQAEAFAIVDALNAGEFGDVPSG